MIFTYLSYEGYDSEPRIKTDDSVRYLPQSEKINLLNELISDLDKGILQRELGLRGFFSAKDVKKQTGVKVIGVDDIHFYYHNGWKKLDEYSIPEFCKSDKNLLCVVNEVELAPEHPLMIKIQEYKEKQEKRKAKLAQNKKQKMIDKARKVLEKAGEL